MTRSILGILFAVLTWPLCAVASNSVINLSHYDVGRPDFVAMKNEGIVGVIHEATYPPLNRDWKYGDRQEAAVEAGLLWGAYHFGDGTNPIRQADHFLNIVSLQQIPIRPDDPEKRRHGVLLVLDFERNGHYPGGTMSTAQAAAFVERIKERTGKYPGLYCSENRLRQMLYAPGARAADREILSNCWLWIANYHAQPRNTFPWSQWHLWQYTGDGKCGLRPRGMFPTRIANMHKVERNIFNGSNSALQTFWAEHAWYPKG
jgi:lysozyme